MCFKCTAQLNQTLHIDCILVKPSKSPFSEMFLISGFKVQHDNVIFKNYGFINTIKLHLYILYYSLVLTFEMPRCQTKIVLPRGFNTPRILSI